MFQNHKRTMKILYLYRNPTMGYSIGKVFGPIERAMENYAEVDSCSMPAFGYSIKSLWQNISMAKKVASFKPYDVIHITGQEHYLIPFLPKNCLVVTIHDLGFAKHTHGLLGRVKRWLFVDSLAKLSNLTCISDKTRAEVSRLCGIEEKKIRVVYNGVNPHFKYCPKVFDQENPVILQIGLMKNKNMERTLVALQGIKCRLRVIAPSKDIDKTIFENSGIDVSFGSDLTDTEIIEEYQKCDIVNLPSLYEGFGMPIIEGQATGRVVVTSNISPMKEIAGPGAVLVDPEDTLSMHEGYIEAINNSQKYIQGGLENVKRFDISMVVKQYLDIYHDICKSNQSKG